jgi:HEPN domain-containing protein
LRAAFSERAAVQVVLSVHIAIVNRENGADMPIFHPDGGDFLPTEPTYWWSEAKRFWDDTLVLIKNNGSRAGVLNGCHAAIERSFKAIIAGTDPRRLSQSRHHNLERLAKEAGVFDQLPDGMAAFIRAQSDLHYSSSYPDKVMARNIWVDTETFNRVVLSANEIYTYLKQNYSGKDQGEEDASLRDC